MDEANIVVAITEARRFIHKAQAAQQRFREDQYTSIRGSPETAAAKRASMDLTRALAKLRKS